MMQEELFKIIWDVSKAGNLLNTREIERLLDIIVQSRNLKEFLKEIRFECLENLKAAYHPLKKRIIIDYENIRETIDTQLPHVSFFQDQERKLYRNLIFVQMLLYEVEHMEQYRKVKSDLLDFESKLLRLCYGPTLYYEMHQSEVTSFDYATIASILSYFEFEAIYYMEDPRERMAQIRSHQQILKLIRSFYKESTDIYQHEENELNFERIHGYKFIKEKFVAPTIAFLSGMTREEALKFFKVDMECKELLNESLKNSILRTYSLEERLLFGLPIRMEEYCEESKKLVF